MKAAKSKAATPISNPKGCPKNVKSGPRKDTANVGSLAKGVKNNQKGLVICADPTNVYNFAEVPPVGEVIDETRFICFEAPLQKDDEETGKLTVDRLMRDVQEMHRSLGMVIDLNENYKFYNPQTFDSINVKHRKIYCPDKDQVPNQNQLNQFYTFVDEYTAQTDGYMDSNAEEILIGVHCTTGIQKTSYFVCKYMVDKLGFSVEQATNAFEKARGCKLEEDVYLTELHNTKPTTALASSSSSLVSLNSQAASVNSQAASVSGSTIPGTTGSTTNKPQTALNQKKNQDGKTKIQTKSVKSGTPNSTPNSSMKSKRRKATSVRAKK